MTDADALTLYATHRDPDAFAYLVQTYQGLVYGTCLRRLRHPADAEDATQETFVKLARKAGDIHTSVAAWLHAAALSTSADLARRSSRRRAHEASAAAVPAVDEAPPDWPAIREALDLAMAELDDAQRGLIAERYFAGRTQAEMAADRGVSQPMMSRRLKDAIETLRHALEDKGFAVVGGTLAAGLAAETTAAPAALTPQLTSVGLAGVHSPASATATAVHSSSRGLKIALAGGTAAVLGGLIGGIIVLNLPPVSTPAPPASPTPAAIGPAERQPVPVPQAIRGVWMGAIRYGDNQTMGITLAATDQQITLFAENAPQEQWVTRPIGTDASTTPPRIDLQTVAGTISPLGSVAEAIYSVDADTLQLAYYDSGSAYPGSFVEPEPEVIVVTRVPHALPAEAYGYWTGEEVGNAQVQREMTLQANNIILRSPDGPEWYDAELIAHDPTANPARFTARILDCPVPAYVGQTVPAIYRLETVGNLQRLTYASLGPGASDLPEDFDPSHGRVFVFERPTPDPQTTSADAPQ